MGLNAVKQWEQLKCKSGMANEIILTDYVDQAGIEPVSAIHNSLRSCASHHSMQAYKINLTVYCSFARISFPCF